MKRARPRVTRARSANKDARDKVHRGSGHMERKPSAYNLWMREIKGKTVREIVFAVVNVV
eukprot:COSAG02_NODE_5129_length_4606_cov_1.720085_4_plen_60_part_00